MSVHAASGTIVSAQPGRLTLLRKSLGAHSLLFAVIAMQIIVYAFMLLAVPGTPYEQPLFGIATLVFTSLPFMLLSLAIMRFYHIARHEKPARPAKALAVDIWRFFSSPRRLANGLPLYLIFLMFGYVFMQLKSGVYSINGFKWDVEFAELDRVLHFGYHPWELLQPLIGYPAVTMFLNIVYNMWFFTMWMVWIYFGFAEQQSEVRTRFFFTFFMLWFVGGNLLAIYFSSAGPNFYGRLELGSDPFAGLLTYLRGVDQYFPIWAIDLQDTMWDDLVGGNQTVGISAMPSMHNGSALLFALAALQVSRFWGRFMIVHAGIILIGSVHLGWHYAVDGYAGWFLCLVIWWISAPVARWWHSRDPQKSYDAELRAMA